jgi:hypothetical protein
MEFAKRNGSRPANGEQRSHRRYPVDAQVAYKIFLDSKIVETGWGKTVNLSSGGILFESASALRAGADVELSVVWPTGRFVLHITGCTLRTAGNRAAVKILNQAFRCSEIDSLQGEISQN